MSADPDRNHSLLAFERDTHANGFRVIAGVDEAGRGPLAGPVVAGAVVLGEVIPDGLDDSKKLTEGHREALFEALYSGGHGIGVGIVSPEEIDELGIQPSNYRAMALAVENLPKVPDFLLIDGFQLPGVVQPQLRIVKGDQRSLSIAAASIIAKVTRDRMMYKLEEIYPGYGFAKHKGYGTRAHLDAIERLGPCPAHRFSFAPLSRTAETRPLFD